MVNLPQKFLSLIFRKFKTKYMKKFAFFVAATMTITAYGQDKVNHEELQKITAQTEAEYNQAMEIAAFKYANHPADEGVSLQAIDHNTPVYYDIDSRPQQRSMNVDYLSDGSLTGVNATGDGYTVYIWDGGKIRLTHQEFGGRITQVETTGSDSDHATGVSGVIMASGVNTNAIGMAPQANLKGLNFTVGSTTAEIGYQSNLPENNDYMISNHSYGSLVGWNYKASEGMWYWYGYPNISENESVLFGFYTDTDKTLDQIMFNAPQHTFFRSAGNNRNEGPGGVVDHYAFDESGNWQLFTGVYRPNDCMSQGGYDCLAFSGSVAKNTINVAAVKNMGGDNRYNGPSSVKMTAFSSWGPTDDGRIKPELSAIGESVTSPTNTSNSAYLNWDGTSFSSPAGAGVGILMEEVKHEFDNGYLRSDMMKALLINSANETGSTPGPDYKFGFGLINALEAARTIINADGKYFTANKDLNQGETFSISFKAHGNEPIKATISWLDPAGTPHPTLVLNDRTPMLVNDLDLRIKKDSETFYPWKLNPDVPNAAATQGDNIVDNVEQVVIDSPVAGQTYTLTVSHKGNLQNGHQNFALVISGIDSPQMKTSDLDLSKLVEVYPIPVIDNLNIRTEKMLNNVHIKIFNEMGQVVYDRTSDKLNKTETIALNLVPAGVYMVFIKSDEGVTTKKIVKK